MMNLGHNFTFLTGTTPKTTSPGVVLEFIKKENQIKTVRKMSKDGIRNIIASKPASNFILLIVPRRYFCGGSYCFMSCCLNFCAVGALGLLLYF